MAAFSQKKWQPNLFKINLLIHKGQNIKLEVKLLRWVLSTGRFILVLVELIVISAFIMRYKLDSELTDLQEQIKEQVPYLQSLQEDEANIRQTQFQLSTIKQIKNEGVDYTGVILRIAQLTPQNTRLNTIAINKGGSTTKTTFSLMGQTPSNLELSAFIQALKKEPTFSEVTLTNISFEGQTLFTITGNLLGTGGRSS